jgi:hypothetical protein
VIVDNTDPAALGRVRADVPRLGIKTEWALPCLPPTGLSCGLLTVPAVGRQVWVEFEEGDITKPVWTGALWEPGEASATPPPVVHVEAAAQIHLAALVVRAGSSGASHPVVRGDALISYLSQLVAQFNSHVHPGSAAGPPASPQPLPLPALLSTTVMVD